MAALDYKFFDTKKHSVAEDWQAHLQEKLPAFQTLVRAGHDGRADLQLWLAELVWAAIRGDLPVARAVEFLAKTPIPARESLQRLFADVLWLVGWAAIEHPQRDMRAEYESLCALLEGQAVLPRQLFALSLETDAMPAAVCQVQQLKKRHNQAKTKAKYTITRYNLLREHTEGYAKLLFLLDRLSSLDWQPEATTKQAEETLSCIGADVERLAGFGHLCPNRILAAVIDIYEQRLVDTDPSPLARPLLALTRRFPPKRLTEVAIFQLICHVPAQSSRDPRGVPLPPPPPPPARPSQFLALAALISMGVVDLDTVWSYLEPSDAAIRQSHADLMAKYDDEVSKLSKIDIGSTMDDRNTFNRAFQAFSQSGHQKFRLITALISLNNWKAAQRVLLHLQKLCKPCLNHHVRSALCDLLKWLIGPVLRPSQRRLPHQSKPSLETSFSCTRRFNFCLSIESEYGAAIVAGTENGSVGAPVTAASLGALRPVEKLDELIPQVRQVLDHLEYFLHTDLHLLSSLWRVLSLYLKQKQKEAGKLDVQVDDSFNVVIFRHLLPAASLVPHNPHLSELMWNVMTNLSVFQRFMIYSCWETMYESFLLKFVCERTKAAAKQILKRVVANAERKDLIAHQSHFHFCKLCHSNPIPAIDTMLKDVEIGFNVNMIQPYVECTNRCPEITADVMAYVLTRSCAKPSTPSRPFLNQADATISSWLMNLAEFVGRFFKKHPHTDLNGLLSMVTRRISAEAVDITPDAPQAEYKGESLIRVVLENLIEFMGGYLTVKDMNPEQLLCLAGGPRLRAESVSVGKKEDSSRKERARNALFTALVDLGLVRVLWYSLSQQRHHFLSEGFSEAHGGDTGLKLLGLLFDGNHDCFLKLTEFLAQACTREKYMNLLPPFEEVFSMFEPALAFLSIRQGLPPFTRTVATGDACDDGAAKLVVADTTTPGVSVEPTDGVAVVESVTSRTPPAAMATDPATASTALSPEELAVLADLERVARMYLPAQFETDGLSIHFYITFWRLSLQDIFTPIEGYDKSLMMNSTSLRQTELMKKNMERDRDYTHSRDYKALKKEAARMQDFQNKLKEEQLLQSANHQRVLARLEHEKKHWFVKPSPHATCAFVHEMIYPRVLTSHSDALFCCHFVRLLIRQKTPGFQLLDFYNSWTIMLTQCIRCCSEREAQIFGVFLREMMSYVLQLRRDETSYAAEMKDNPCFHRNYYEDTSNAKIEWAAFADIRKGHSKWEGRIYKALRQGLDSEDWMEKRNALLLVSQCYESFPVVDKYAKIILQCVENLMEKEELSDVKTLATSLAVKLRSRREFWVDKASPSVTEHSRRGGEDGKLKEDGRSSTGRSKNALGVPVAQVTNVVEPLARGAKRLAVDHDSAPEKRTRRDEEPHGGGGSAPAGSRSKAEAKPDNKEDKTKDEKEAREPKEPKEHREHKDKEAKEGKEVKEGKNRERGDAKPPKEKEAREPREARGERIDGKESKRAAGDRQREKEPGEKQRSDKAERERDKTAAKNAGEKEKVGSATPGKDHGKQRGSVAGSGAGVGGSSVSSSGVGSNAAVAATDPSVVDAGGTAAAALRDIRRKEPPGVEERSEKRRRTERDGESGSHGGAPAATHSNSRSGGGGTSGGGVVDHITSRSAAGGGSGGGSGGGTGGGHSSAGAGHQPRNALAPAPEPAGSQYYNRPPSSGGGHDYQRRGYAHPPSAGSGGGGGGRYDHRSRR